MFNKKYKSICLILIALIMLFSSIAVYAEENEIKSNTTITYGSDESFTIIIPSTFIINTNGDAVMQELKAKDVMIKSNSILEVQIISINYEDSWKVIDILNKNNKLSYAIKSKDSSQVFLNNSKVLSVEAGAIYGSEIKTELYFSIIDKTIAYGLYTDTLTFIADIIRN